MNAGFHGNLFFSVVMLISVEEIDKIKNFYKWCGNRESIKGI